MENKTVLELLGEVATEMCDNYCKYPKEYDPDDNEIMLDTICANCPLNKLGAV